MSAEPGCPSFSSDVGNWSEVDGTFAEDEFPSALSCLYSDGGGNRR